MKLKHYQKGLAIVEAAIILPLFLVLMFGIIELGIVLYDKAVITNASREAARSGIALKSPKLTTDDIEQVAIDYCTDNLINFDAANLDVNADQSVPANFGTPLIVAVQYDYQNMVLGNLLSLLSGGTFPDPLVLSAQTTMNNE